ncbi:uncharacterized protein IL334_006804 [Kwoniella shivajii]|uniref:Uncharacterized protein n=1 Tax=Kwoniella shivajii TaxID=564305 RepID=A0ABZ1D7C1_9TREE|nr:hypothetical protein IL334_006804 [Kwoniella shivajii]
MSTPTLFTLNITENEQDLANENGNGDEDEDEDGNGVGLGLSSNYYSINNNHKTREVDSPIQIPITLNEEPDSYYS